MNELTTEFTALDTERCWEALMARDARYDGMFVTAVRSTGIYCRPSCTSRHPKRENVTFFPLPAAAEQAGFRPCKRCRPQEAVIRDPQAEVVQQVCRYIADHLDQPLTLEELGEQVHLSPYHLQRTFKHIMGISPREYTEACRVQHFKTQLRSGNNVTDALYEAGFSSSSRLYDRASANLGMTPAAYRKGGVGMNVRYTIVDCPLGRLLVAATERGVSAVCLGDVDADLEAALAHEYPNAEVKRDENTLGAWVQAILDYLNGWQPHLDLPIDVQATAFQRRVWRELQAIPYGETRSYSAVAKALGEPKATRAVARACATNPVALVVPCHRVVREDGGMGGYRWGMKRKEALLKQERETART
jgi:AraC family transcriptional regulator of adaptative response/methylated-DNA-[protein]-cysteine methyltransferase